MNIKPIKMELHRVEIVGKLDEYTSEVVKDLMPKLQGLSYYNPITIAQKGDLLLLNSGAKTSFINMKNMEKFNELEKMIADNVHENTKFNTRSIEYIA